MRDIYNWGMRDWGIYNGGMREGHTTWGHEGRAYNMGAWGGHITWEHEKGHKWTPDGSFEWSDKIKMHIRSFLVFLQKEKSKKCWSVKALDKVLDTIDDAKTHPKGPQPYLKQSKKSKFSFTFSSYMIVYDDRLWWSSMIIVYDNRPRLSSKIIVLDYRLRLSSKIIV